MSPPAQPSAAAVPARDVPAAKPLAARPLVTVVTPVLNRVDTLGRCLASLASQTHTNIEHIVVDGGSTDGTLELLEQADVPYDLKWVSGPDTGMYDAINKGLAMATGDVLTYLNSDDLFLPWTLEVAIDALRGGVDGQPADMVFGDLAISTSRPNGTPYVYLQFYPDFDATYYTHVATIAQPTVTWRREVTDDLGVFDDSYRLLGDCEYWLRTAAAGRRIVHVDEVQAVQLDHDGTLRVTQADRLATEFLRLRSEYASKAGPAPDARVARARKSLLWRAGQMRLAREIGRAKPQRWPQFVQFLRDHDIEVDRRRLLAFQLPERLRPDVATWLDPEQFERELDVAFRNRP